MNAAHLIDTYFGEGWTIRRMDPRHPGKEGDKAISFDDGICALISGDESFTIKAFSAKRAANGIMLRVIPDTGAAWWMDRGLI